jgi:hypothetical protein
MAGIVVDARRPWLGRRIGASTEVEGIEKLKKKW